jgi:hypothetical protein
MISSLNSTIPTGRANPSKFILQNTIGVYPVLNSAHKESSDHQPSAIPSICQTFPGRSGERAK